MYDIMISIHKDYTDDIFLGIKQIEWRTVPLSPGKYFIYEPKKNGGHAAIVGSMYITKTYTFFNVDEIPGKIIRDGCVSKEFLRKYSKGKTLYANVIFNPSRFDKPKPLSDFISYSKCVPCKYPPQSYYYVNEREI